MCLSLYNEDHRLIFECRLKITFDSCTSTQDHVRYFHFDTKVSSIIHFDIFFRDSYYLRSIHFDTFFTSTYSHRIKSLLRSFHFDSKFHVDRFTSIQSFMSIVSLRYKNFTSIHSLRQKPHFFKTCTSILLFHIDVALRLIMHFDTWRRFRTKRNKSIQVQVLKNEVCVEVNEST